MYQGFQSANSRMPFVYPRAPPTDIPLYAYLGESYALYGVQYAHTANSGMQMVIHGLMNPAQMFPKCDTPHIHPQFQAPLALMPYYSFPYIVATQYQQPPQAQILQSQQTTQHNRNQGRDDKDRGS